MLRRAPPHPGTELPRQPPPLPGAVGVASRLPPWPVWAGGRPGAVTPGGLGPGKNHACWSQGFRGAFPSSARPQGDLRGNLQHKLQELSQQVAKGVLGWGWHARSPTQRRARETPPPSCWSLSSMFWGTDLADTVTLPPPALAASPRAREGCSSWHLDFSLLWSGCVCSWLTSPGRCEDLIPKRETMSGRGGRGAGHQLCPSGFPVRPDPQQKESHIRKETGNNPPHLVPLYVHDRVRIESRKAVSSHSRNKARWVQESSRGADEPPTQKTLRALLPGQ